jgi:hypothetical protein
MPNKLEENDWDLLLRRIKDGNCTPFLGAGACCDKIPPGSRIANEWAEKYDYPMEDSYDLMRVAQYVAVTEDAMTPKEEICKMIEERSKIIPTKCFEFPDDIHGVLADLPLPVYITTNYDDFMVRALKSREKSPTQEICRWSKRIKQPKRTSSSFEPTPENPMVYHLHGFYEMPESLVLTEYDYLDFLAAISKKQNLLPPRIQEAFTDSSLLFLGYRIANWDFHVLFRILVEYLEISTRKKHLSVQLVPGNVSENQKEKAQNYLDRYFNDFNNLHIQVYWQDCREFAAELKKRWEAYTCDTIKKDVGKMDIIVRDLGAVKNIPSMENIDRFKTEYEQTGQTKEEMNKVSMLFLAADPTDASRLRLGEEFREIQEKLKLAKLRDHFKLELPQLSVRPSDITQALLDTQPQIVHFSGHGTSAGALCIENQAGKTHSIRPDDLASLFEQFSDQVNCVILNACYSEIQAKAISKHIKHVIGMNKAIGDKAAIAFAIGFYQALGGGRSIEDAYKLGCVSIRLENIPEHLTPVLIKQDQSQLSPPNKIENTLGGF